MKPSKKTVKYFEPVLEWLDNGGKHTIAFNMDFFLVDTEDNSMYQGEQPPSDCGSICCIAGAITHFNKDPIFDECFARSSAVDNCYLVGKIIGMEKYEVGQLFLPTDVGGLDSIHPHQAAKTIRNWIETGEIVWNIESEEQ